MEAQSLLPRCCPNSTIRSNPNSRDASSSYPGFRALSGQSLLAQKHLSLQPHSFAPPHSYRARFKNRLECSKNSNTKLAGDAITGEGDETRPPRVTRKRLALFVSGGGSNFRSIHEASLRGSIPGDVVVLVTNKRGCGGATYAMDNGIPVILFPSSKDEPEGLSPADLVIALRRFKVDFILLAGYLKLIPAELIRSYPRSILNIHPSLLPSFGGKGFYGMKVHKAVISSGARYSGPTIHFVDEHFDTGRILAQRVVPVLANDTADDLAARVLHEEHNLYVEMTSALCEERIIWRGDGVPLIRSRENPDKFS